MSVKTTRGGGGDAGEGGRKGGGGGSVWILEVCLFGFKQFKSFKRCLWVPLADCVTTPCKSVFALEMICLFTSLHNCYDVLRRIKKTITDISE